jgi:hypothetical protein
MFGTQNIATAKATANDRKTRREEYMVHALSLVQAAMPKAAYDLSTKPRPHSASFGKLLSSNLIEQKPDQRLTYNAGPAFGPVRPAI